MIGYSGSTGNAKGSNEWEQHLHFEFRDSLMGGKTLEGRIDPEFFFGSPPWVLQKGGWVMNSGISQGYETAAPEEYTPY